MDQSRLARLRSAMEAADLPALLVAQPEARRYLSGYSAKDLPPRDSAGWLVISHDDQYLLTDPRTEAQAADEATDFELRVAPAGTRVPELLKGLLSERGIRRIGFDARYLTYADWEELRSVLDGAAELVAAPDLVDRLRMVKDDAEIAAMRASISMNDAVFAHLVRTVEPGRTELEMAWEMESWVRAQGAQGPAFDPITVAGPGSASPHAVPSDRRIGPDELVLFDIGSKVNGYCSDMTRTFCIESVPQRLRDVWKVVYDVQLEAEARVRPGMQAKDLDAMAREAIQKRGYGDYFTHGLGHGIGLEVHEPPWLTRSRGEDELLPGMLFTIEPGVYLSGEGGVRLEDVVLLTETGAEVLCSSPKRLELADILEELGPPNTALPELVEGQAQGERMGGRD